MNDYVVSCCSTADLSEEHFKRRNIEYLCFHYSINGQEHSDDLGKSIPFDKFYQMMKDGAMTKTSQVTTGEYVEYFSRFLSAGKDVFHVCLSSGISGTYDSAMMAVNALKDKFPDRKLLVLDSLGASSGYGLLMDEIADRRDAGMSIDEIFKWASEFRYKVNHWFFSTDLTFYVRGGRISKAAGWMGGIFDICPLLNVDKYGRLRPRYKIRTKKRVISAIVQRMVEGADNGTDYNGKCFISNSACLDDAEAVAAMIEERFPHLNGKVLINNIGTTIGSHTGPGTVAVFFIGQDRREYVAPGGSKD